MCRFVQDAPFNTTRTNWNMQAKRRVKKAIRTQVEKHFRNEGIQHAVQKINTVKIMTRYHRQRPRFPDRRPFDQRSHNDVSRKMVNGRRKKKKKTTQPVG